MSITHFFLWTLRKSYFPVPFFGRYLYRQLELSITVYIVLSIISTVFILIIVTSRTPQSITLMVPIVASNSNVK